jgi:LDH2 family malate/lactate/ureidoglycolate dehydrogenase
VSAAEPSETVAARYPAAELDRFCRAAFAAVGADGPNGDAATRAMMHASRLGVDSHGVRLLGHYLAAFEGGRLAKHPSPRFMREGGASAVLDADHAHGALATYLATDRAVALAGRFGVGAVAIANSSHFGAAGAYALAAAEAGCIGLVTCNTDSFVRLHGGADRFHGTNPIAAAAPVAGERPWLLDMATSAIPYNRVRLYRSFGVALPDGVASTDDGADTRDPDAASMLAPLGAAFGFKGAGLAGLVEILSAVLSGMRLSFDIEQMQGVPLTTPREMGAFVLALKPDAFVDRARFDAGMARYLATLRASRTAEGETVMAPGDREWAEADRRVRTGIPIDPDSDRAFADIAARFGIAPPRSRSA